MLKVEVVNNPCNCTVYLVDYFNRSEPQFVFIDETVYLGI